MGVEFRKKKPVSETLKSVHLTFSSEMRVLRRSEDAKHGHLKEHG